MKRMILMFASLIMCLSSFAALPNMSLGAPVALPPFTFAGRLADASHTAFGADDIAEVRAYSKDGATLLAKSSTVAPSGTFYNFSLDIPVATAAKEGYVLPGTKVKLVFVDGDGNRYDSVVSDEDTVVGNPGECKVLSAFLGTDENKDGIADEYAELYLVYGQYLGYDLASFDAQADYDGDGQSNLAEYVAGTDPFLAEDVFDVGAFEIDFWPKDSSGVTLSDWVQVTFPTSQGRCYSVHTASALNGDAWQLGTFSYAPVADAQAEKFHVTDSSASEACSLFLPKEVDSRFWRFAVE